MSLKDKRYKRVYALTSVILLLVIIGAGYHILQKEQQLNNFKNQNLVPESELITLEKEKSNYEKLLEIDLFWLVNKDVNATLNKLKSFEAEKGIKKDWVENRIERLEDILASSKDDELTKINLRSELRTQTKMIDSLNSVSDSLDLKNTVIETTYQKKIDSLTRLVKEKNTLLERNETVKVISFRNENKHLIHYIGETADEMANGSGVGIWNTGSIYRGEWVNNKRNGKGEFVWDDGAKYEGDFVMGERSGNGIFYYSSGEKYIGEFKKGLRHGQGVLYDKDGNISYEGNWKNDKPNQ